jgi:hypothetical protein
MLRPLRHAFRQLRNSPGFSLTAFLTLSLGIGSCTAIFAVLDAVLLKPLPFAQPDRLVPFLPSLGIAYPFRPCRTTFPAPPHWLAWLRIGDGRRNNRQVPRRLTESSW